MEETKIEKVEANIGEEIEKSSFTPYMQKQVKKLRKKGLEYGVSVPYLNYELDKPEKQRKIFNVIAIIFFVLAMAMVIGTVVMYFYTHIFSAIFEIANKSNDLTSYDTLQNSLGLSGFVGIASWALVLILAVISLLPIPIIIVTINFARKNLSFAKMSKQEMAKGFEIKNFIIFLIFSAIFSLALAIILLCQGMASGAFGICSVVFLFLLFVICVALSVIIIKEKNKETQWFNTLPIEKQQDFLNFNKSLNLVKSKKSQSRRI